MKNYVLDSIISDNLFSSEPQTLTEMLFELKEMPEHYVNSCFDISFDEMSEQEKTKAVQDIENYLKQNA